VTIARAKHSRSGRLLGASRRREFFTALEERGWRSRTDATGQLKRQPVCGRAQGLTLTDREFRHRAADPEGDPRADCASWVDVGTGLPDGESHGRHAVRAARRSAFAWRRQIGSGLTGVLYILDEPSIGLQPARTNARLIRNARAACAIWGNTLDRRRARRRDDARKRTGIVDMGPGARGRARPVGWSPKATIEDIMARPGVAHRAIPEWHPGVVGLADRANAKGSGQVGAPIVGGGAKNNLKDITAEIPLGRNGGQSPGVSGSGKSVADHQHVVFQRLSQRLFQVAPRQRGAQPSGSKGWSTSTRSSTSTSRRIGPHAQIEPGDLRRFVHVDQGTSFAQVPESRVRGAINLGGFSFNVKGGPPARACQGDGQS